MRCSLTLIQASASSSCVSLGPRSPLRMWCHVCTLSARWWTHLMLGHTLQRTRSTSASFVLLQSIGNHENVFVRSGCWHKFMIWFRFASLRFDSVLYQFIWIYIRFSACQFFSREESLYHWSCKLNYVNIILFTLHIHFLKYKHGGCNKNLLSWQI